MTMIIIRMIRKNRRLWRYYTSHECYRQDYGYYGMVTDDKEMAELLNDQFCTVFTRERVERPENEQLFMREGELEYMEFQAGKVKKN